jgi:hypothetical protein
MADHRQIFADEWNVNLVVAAQGALVLPQLAGLRMDRGALRIAMGLTGRCAENVVMCRKRINAALMSNARHQRSDLS